MTHATPEAHARLGIGRTFQVPATFEGMSVIDNVMVGAFLRHPHQETRVSTQAASIELTGLKTQTDLAAHSLGTPGRKRLEIARVLATNPRLMLLDESLAGLTPPNYRRRFAWSAKSHEMGITIVIVEHIMEIIMTLAGRVLAFNQGHVIAGGKPEDVVKDEKAVIEAYLGRGSQRVRRRST